MWAASTKSVRLAGIGQSNKGARVNPCGIFSCICISLRTFASTRDSTVALGRCVATALQKKNNSASYESLFLQKQAATYFALLR